MTKRQKKKWHKILNGLIKIVLLLVLFFLVILVIFILFLLPDLIMSFRLFLYNRVHLKLNLSYISSSDTYIQMMISIISCCITAIMSFFTYRLTKILRTMEAEQYGAKLLTAAFRLKKNIENNCWIIFNANKNTGTLEKLQYLSNLDETWFVLRVADEIDKEDSNFLEKYNDRIKELDHYSGETDQTKNLENEFCKTFISSSIQFGYTDQMDKLLRKLEKIIERSTQDE